MAKRKPAGYWKVKENCIEAGKSCSSRGEFIRKYNAAYQSAKANGWYEECVSHLNSDPRGSHKYSTKEDCLEVARGCTTRTEFIKKHNAAYQSAKSNGWYEDCVAHMDAGRKPAGFWLVKENCVKAARECSTRGEFSMRFSRAYDRAQLNGWMDECCEHMGPPMKSGKPGYTDEEILEHARQFSSPSNWSRNNKSIYNAALRRGDAFYAQCTAHMTKARRGYTDEWFMEQAAQHETFKSWREADQAAYSSAYQRGEEFWARCTSHMVQAGGRVGKYTDDELLAEARKHKTVRDWESANSAMKQAAYKKGAEFYAKCKAHMEKAPNCKLGLSDDELIAEAQKHKTIKDWRKNGRGYQTAYRRCKKLYAKCIAHMEKRKPKLKYTDKQLLADAKKHETLASFMRDGLGQQAYRRGGEVWEKCRAHMRSNEPSDNDALYVWEWMISGQGTGIYKHGMTSWRLGTKRIEECAASNGLDHRLVFLIRTEGGKATAIESAILAGGEPVAMPPWVTDGRTEFRRFGPKAMETINQLVAIAEGKPIETQKLEVRR